MAQALCMLGKARNTHLRYIVRLAFPQQQCFHERASMLRYTYIVCFGYYFFPLAKVLS